MPQARREVLQKLWFGRDPFDERSAFNGRVDFQGWASDHIYLSRAVQECSPRIVVEVGVWKGGSVLTMAEEARRLGLDTCIIAVDTWLGASEHWMDRQWFESLRIEAGYPTLYRTFMANIIDRDLCDYVVPLPLDSLNAAAVLAHNAIGADVIHIDGGHDYDSVTADLKVWWPKLREGGVLLGDDYHPEGVEVWPEVRKAFHAFFDVSALQNTGGKCFVEKRPGR